MTKQEIYINAIENAVKYGHTAGIRMYHRLYWIPALRIYKQVIPVCVHVVLQHPEDFSSECVRIARKRKEGEWYDAAD